MLHARTASINRADRLAILPLIACARSNTAPVLCVGRCASLREACEAQGTYTRKYSKFTLSGTIKALPPFCEALGAKTPAYSKGRVKSKPAPPVRGGRRWSAPRRASAIGKDGPHGLRKRRPRPAPSGPAQLPQTKRSELKTSRSGPQVPRLAQPALPRSCRKASGAYQPRHGEAPLQTRVRMALPISGLPLPPVLVF